MEIYYDIKQIPKERPNCNVVIINNNISNDEFDREKEMQDYIYDNIDSFINELANDTVIECEKEYRIKDKLLNKSKKRIDIFVKGKDSAYIIELKKPKYNCENIKALGQLLDYGRKIGKNGTLVLVTSKFDVETAKTIEYYKLPITYVYLTKKRMFVYGGEYDARR